MAGEGHSCFGPRAEIRVLLDVAETGPGSQQTPLVWERRCAQAGSGLLPDLVLSSAAGPGSGAELLQAWTEGPASVQVARCRSGTDPPPAPVSGVETRGQESSGRQAGRLSSVDAALSWSSPRERGLAACMQLPLVMLEKCVNSLFLVECCLNWPSPCCRRSQGSR